MPRTSIIIVVGFFILAWSNNSLAARAASCGQKVQGYTIYENLEKGKIVEKFSTFDIDEWSDSSAFEGIVVLGNKTATVEMEIRKEGKTLKKGSWKLTPWEKNKTFSATENLDAADFFQDSAEDSYFVIRLMNQGKTICETSPKKISVED